MSDDTKDGIKIVKGPEGEDAEGIPVEVEEALERYSEVRLSDGSILKVKTSVIEAIRLMGKYDNNGNPVYLVNSHNSVIVSESPPELRSKPH